MLEKQVVIDQIEVVETGVYKSVLPQRLWMTVKRLAVRFIVILLCQAQTTALKMLKFKPSARQFTRLKRLRRIKQR